MSDIQRINGDHLPLLLPIARVVLESGRSRSRVYKALAKNELEAVNDGKATLVTRNSFIEWVNRFTPYQPGRIKIREKSKADATS